MAAQPITVDDLEDSIAQLTNELGETLKKNDDLTAEREAWLNEARAEMERLGHERQTIKDSPHLTDQEKAEEYRDINQREEATAKQDKERIAAINGCRGQIRRLQGTIDGQRRVLARAQARLATEAEKSGLCYQTHPHDAKGCTKEGCGPGTCIWTPEQLQDKAARRAHDAGSPPPALEGATPPT